MRSKIVHAILSAAIAGWLLLLTASLAYASVASSRIAELAEWSQLIVLAKVESIRGVNVLGNRRATARVKEVWKGQNVETVEYPVSPTDFCDITNAHRGETVVLFMRKDKKAGWRIISAGRGRMPLKRIDGVDYLTFYGVIFPKEITRIDLEKLGSYEFDSGVELSVVKELVRKTTDSTK